MLPYSRKTAKTEPNGKLKELYRLTRHVRACRARNRFAHHADFGGVFVADCFSPLRVDPVSVPMSVPWIYAGLTAGLVITASIIFLPFPRIFKKREALVRAQNAEKPDETEVFES